jgi:hypothetical protein
MRFNLSPKRLDALALAMHEQLCARNAILLEGIAASTALLAKLIVEGNNALDEAETAKLLQRTVQSLIE